ncbi:hypothetical protein ILUMI_25125 [Ignelater luminosus]|uniref:Reverse transcriptase/retrotransposon-derived protein RNase H-like domain-containing protein n=1 Tax=Ignelater luminosus TaxID=2038154 RepID=A0A8K0CB50_IGNLU|nr:hypothetical protein ILUMI_25125 [Ignelater luminosus]
MRQAYRVFSVVSMLLNRPPFRIKPVCGLFQHKIGKVLQGAKGTINYVNDIVVTGKDCTEHLNNLKEVLSRISYLGIRKDSVKIAAVVKAPRPESVTELGECEDVFTKAKQAITTERSLVHFDNNLPIKLVCNAINLEMGAVLLHIYKDGFEKPTYFTLWSLTKTKRKTFCNS